MRLQQYVGINDFNDLVVAKSIALQKMSDLLSVENVGPPVLEQKTLRYCLEWDTMLK